MCHDGTDIADGDLIVYLDEKVTCVDLEISQWFDSGIELWCYCVETGGCPEAKK